jgi:hypothetical protein
VFDLADPFLGYSIAIEVLAIMIAVGGIIFGVGLAINDRRLKQIGQSELYQVVINGAIIGAFIVLFVPGGLISALLGSMTTGVSGTSCSAYPNNPATCFATSYLSGVSDVTINGNPYQSLLTSNLELLSASALLYAGVGTLSSVKLDLFIISFGLQGLNAILGPLKGIIDFLSLSSVFIIAQSMLLGFFYYTALPLMLPVGIVLRTVYFTRKLGGAIIAIAIGGYLILPLTYVFSAVLLNTFYVNALATPVSSTVSSINTFLSSVQSLQGSAFSLGSTQSANTINFNLVGVVTSGIGVLTSSFNLVLSAIWDSMVVLIIQVFFLPIFSMILTFISVKELAKLLGSEISLEHLNVF